MNAPTESQILPLHAHSSYSLLDGASAVEDYVDYAVDHDLSYVAISDHGLLTGQYALHCSCRKHGVSAIHAVEAYLVPRPGYVVNPALKPFNYHHVTLWARNQAGWRDLMALCSNAWTGDRVIKNKPRITYDDLSLYGRNLLCGSACIFGPIAYPWVRGEREEAVRAAHLLKDIFGAERLFMEVMPHAVDRDWVGRNGELVTVRVDGGVLRFAPDDVLETDRGSVKAKDAGAAGVGEIYSASPTRVQDVPFSQPETTNPII